ncbi:MAG: fimbria/pilus periplasmic chaperone [Bacteriovoracaceae bacterium]
MSATFALTGRDASKLFELENDSNEKIAVRLSMSKRLMDEEGKETQPEVEDDFLIQPFHIVMDPFQKKAVRVTWMKGENFKDELAYRLIAEQLPIDMGDKAEKNKRQANIKVLLRYVAAVYVDPGTTQSNVTVVKQEHDSIKKKLIITLNNSGNKHQILKNLKVKIKNGDQGETSIEAAGLAGFIGENILAQSTRKFVIAVPNEIKKLNPNFTVSIDFDKN